MDSTLQVTQLVNHSVARSTEYTSLVTTHSHLSRSLFTKQTALSHLVSIHSTSQLSTKMQMVSTTLALKDATSILLNFSTKLIWYRLKKYSRQSISYLLKSATLTSLGPTETKEPTTSLRSKSKMDWMLYPHIMMQPTQVESTSDSQ